MNFFIYLNNLLIAVLLFRYILNVLDNYILTWLPHCYEAAMFIKYCMSKQILQVELFYKDR